MKRRIVIADDDPTVINLVSLRLSLARFDVLSADSAPAVLELVKTATPDAVLLDVRMPGGGLAALEALKSDPATSNLPVMMLTGERDPSTVMQAMGAGANDYMVKPFHPDRLLDRVQRLVKSSSMVWTGPAPATATWEL